MLGAFFMATDMVTSPITKKANGFWIEQDNCCYYGLWGGLPKCFIHITDERVDTLINRFTNPEYLGRIGDRNDTLKDFIRYQPENPSLECL